MIYEICENREKELELECKQDLFLLKSIDIHLKRMIYENKELKLECKQDLSLLKILIYIYTSSKE